MKLQSDILGISFFIASNIRAHIIPFVLQEVYNNYIRIAIWPCICSDSTHLASATRVRYKLIMFVCLSPQLANQLSNFVRWFISTDNIAIAQVLMYNTNPLQSRQAHSRDLVSKKVANGERSRLNLVSCSLDTWTATWMLVTRWDQFATYPW